MIADYEGDGDQVDLVHCFASVLGNVVALKNPTVYDYIADLDKDRAEGKDHFKKNTIRLWRRRKGETKLPTYGELLEFVKYVRDKEYDPPEQWNISGEDAADERNEMIEEAMRILGALSKCDHCDAEVPYSIGCPDGREVCQDCFDNGIG